MAELTPTKVGKRIPVGDEFEQTYRVSCGAASAAEWFATDFRKVTKIVGAVPQGTTGANVNTVKNSGTGTTGTSGSEDANPGNVAVETSAAVTLEITVRGQL
jgi:hypothetical protein